MFFLPFRRTFLVPTCIYIYLLYLTSGNFPCCPISSGIFYIVSYMSPIHIYCVHIVPRNMCIDHLSIDHLPIHFPFPPGYDHCPSSRPGISLHRWRTRSSSHGPRLNSTSPQHIHRTIGDNANKRLKGATWCNICHIPLSYILRIDASHHYITNNCQFVHSDTYPCSLS